MSARCPMCDQPACKGHGFAGVELRGDRSACKVRFRVLFRGGSAFCGAIPAKEALELGWQLIHEARRVLDPSLADDPEFPE